MEVLPNGGFLITRRKTGETLTILESDTKECQELGERLSHFGAVDGGCPVIISEALGSYFGEGTAFPAGIGHINPHYLSDQRRSSLGPFMRVRIQTHRSSLRHLDGKLATIEPVPFSGMGVTLSVDGQSQMVVLPYGTLKLVGFPRFSRHGEVLVFRDTLPTESFGGTDYGPMVGKKLIVKDVSCTPDNTYVYSLGDTGVWAPESILSNQHLLTLT